MSEKIVFKYIDIPGAEQLAVYREHGGYSNLKQVLTTKQPAEVTGIVKDSGIRGRGGAGFPAGVKWGFLPQQQEKPVYLVCNADEGEPGTFKDRELIEKSPHQLLEGMIVACYAIGAEKAYIYIRGEFVKGARILNEAILEARTAGLLGDDVLGTGVKVDIFVHRGAGAYICGEETALLESIEGKRGQPRLKPPFPAVVGLYESPTIINNVETLAALPAILEQGAEWYRSLGTEKSAGSKLFSISGHLARPGVYEVKLGTPLMELINDHAGGIREGHTLKACIPGGSSVPILTAEECQTAKLDYESLEAQGTMLGSGAVIVMDETTSIPRTTSNLADFYAHESCGQCTPCREGTRWLAQILHRILDGKGRTEDLDLLLDICDNISLKTICPLGDAAIAPVQSAVTKFRSEFEEFIAGNGAPRMAAATNFGSEV
jgi:NADH-quinone oxidoreductase subunit F